MEPSSTFEGGFLFVTYLLKTLTMKHLLNNMSEEEKNSIREQHSGGIKLDNKKFQMLVESKLGEVKPFLLNEQFARPMESWERIDKAFECTGLKTEGAGWTAQSMEILEKMPLLSKIMSATNELDMTNPSKWKKNDLRSALNQIGSQKNSISKILSCYLKGIGMSNLAADPLKSFSDLM